MGAKSTLQGQNLVLMSQDDLCEVLKDTYFQRFSGVEVNSEAVCQILQISMPTLNRWVKGKVISPVNEGQHTKRRFDLSYILRQDRSELKSKYRYERES